MSARTPTTERTWREQAGWVSLPDLELTAVDGGPAEHLLVAVAHPDDETLALGGLIHDAGRLGIRTTVLCASDGEASHPQSRTHSRADLADIRRREFDRALGILNPDASGRCLGLDDGTLSEHVSDVASAITALADTSTLIASTWRRDGHPDHEAVGRAAAAAADALGCRHLEAPIWTWAWSSPDQVPWALLALHHLAPETARCKQAAIGAYRSQTEPLSQDPADAAVLSESVLEHFDRPFETVVEQPPEGVVTPVPPTVFDRMYDAGDDPWDYEHSWYEERKRMTTLAALPARGLGRVLELGPATGLLTVGLARRAESLVSIDVSEEALRRALRRVEDEGLDDRVELYQGRVPDTWPEGVFDTIVVSEVAYFLTREEWAETLRSIRASLARDGCVVLVHWAHPLTDTPLDTDLAHDMAVAVTGLRTTVHHVEPDFVLRVLRPRGLPSIAAEEGRV
jgi:LmbE family N-acetylglucosaminyl deacetylase